MRASRTASRDDARPAAVVEWRRHRLIAAGFGSDLAAELAGGDDTDLLAVLELVDRGCPPKLAARILAPLDSSKSERCPR
jgi:hypothetical protein